MTDQTALISAIAIDAERAVRELIDIAHIRAGQILVVGCSSSEMIGEHIGKHSSLEAAEALCSAIEPILSDKGIYLAAQCCEHLNRAIIIERACAEQYGLDPVWVKPQPKAGGSFATTVWAHMHDPVAVETILAHAGMDIGSTLIGMHLRAVAVPVRLSLAAIGEASILCARTRPKYVGGPRAQYK